MDDKMKILLMVYMKNANIENTLPGKHFKIYILKKVSNKQTNRRNWGQRGIL